MRLLWLIVCFLFVVVRSGHAQQRLGLDDQRQVTPLEAQLLDSLLLAQRGAFSFTNKQVAFMTGSTGTRQQTKREFFQHSLLPWTQQQRTPVLTFWPLTEAEKRATSGYDAVVFAWVKGVPNQGKVLKRLR